MASPGALIALHEALETEQAKRAKQRGFPISEEDARREFYEMLDEMHERAKAAPDHREPTLGERAAHMRDLEAWARHFRKRNGG